MGDVTSGVLSINAATRFQLSAERFQMSESTSKYTTLATCRDVQEFEDGVCSSKTGVSSSSSWRRPASSDDPSPSTWLNDETQLLPGGSADEARLRLPGMDSDMVERLGTESAVGRLARMIERFTGNNQRGPWSRHFYQATPSDLPVASPDDVTMPRDRARYFCHVCPYVGSSKEEYNLHVQSHFEHHCTECTYSSRTEGRLRRHIKEFHGSQDDAVNHITTSSLTSDLSRSPQQHRLIKCRQCAFSTRVREEFWIHSRVHIRRERMLSCPKCPFVTEFKHHLEYHLRNHIGSKPFRCSRCNYSCVNRSMLNSHAKSHTNVYQYRCADCAYATKYCHSLKLHLRKHGHHAATVLNPDGSLPTDGSGDFERVARRGPPRGPRTAPPSALSRRKLSFDDVTVTDADGDVKRAWSAEAEIGGSSAVSESIPRLLPADSSWQPKPFPVEQELTSSESLTSTTHDPYAFIADDDAECINLRGGTDIKRWSPRKSYDDSQLVPEVKRPATLDDERHLPVRKRLRNAEFIARLTANIEAELNTEDRPLDLTTKLTSTLKENPTTKVQVDDVDASSSSPMSGSSNASRGAQRRKGVALRRTDVIKTVGDDVTAAVCEAMSSDDSNTTGPCTASTSPLPPTDQRSFVECRHCRIGFRDRVTYSLHMGYHGFDAPFSCNMCGHQSADRVEFFVHIATAAH